MDPARGSDIGNPTWPMTWISKNRVRRPTEAVLVLLSSAAVLAAAACGGGDSVTGGGGSASVASVIVTPALDTAVSINEVVAFTATATDASGKAISGVALTWSSSDEAVATVSTSGQASARSSGTARIVASASGAADTAILVVDQRPAEVLVSPDSVRLAAPGDTARFSAAVRDALGNAVQDAPPVEWSVSDTTVAVVDGAGLVTARQTGRVTVSATVPSAGSSTVSGTAALRVSSTTPPRILAVAPLPLQEGGTATITGTDFDPGAVGDSVQVDGLPATVTSASSTSLEITVPTYDCLPPRSVVVRVATDGGVDQTSGPLQPDESPISLTVGRQAVLTDPSGYCLQFPATAASERYVIGVQSLASTVGSPTSVEVTGEAANGQGAASVAAVSAEISQRLRPVGGGDLTPRTPSWWRSQLRAEMKLRAWERSHLDPRASIPATSGISGTPAPGLSVSGGQAVGDTVSLRVPDINASNACTSFTSVTATVRAIGQRAIVVADTGNPANGFTQADYQSFSDRLDNGIFDTDVAYFGDPGDIDSNGHIVVLFTKAVNAMANKASNSAILGFVFSGDWFPRLSTTSPSCPSSDEGEIYYGRVPDPNGTVTDSAVASKRSDELSRAPQVMAHELTHLIQFGRRFALDLGFMGSIVAEGQATFGEEVVGHAETGNQPYQNYGADVIFGTTGTDSVAWYLNKFTDLAVYFGFDFRHRDTRVAGAPELCGWWQSDPSPCVGRPLWYGVSWSFLRWVADQYGPSYPGGEEALQQDIISNAGSDPQMVADVVGQPLPTLLARWSAALYVDDRILGPDPSLTFTSWNLHDFELNTVSTAHLQPYEETFGDWTQGVDVRASSTAYVAVGGSGRPATAVKVRDPSGLVLAPSIQVWIVRMQ